MKNDYFQKKDGLTVLLHHMSQVCVSEQNICLHGVLCSIAYNLICNMTNLDKNVLIL